MQVRLFEYGSLSRASPVPLTLGSFGIGDCLLAHLQGPHCIPCQKPKFQNHRIICKIKSVFFSYAWYVSLISIEVENVLGPCSVLAQTMMLFMIHDFFVSNTHKCVRRKKDQFQEGEDTKISYFSAAKTKLSTIPLKLYFQKLWISFPVETYKTVQDPPPPISFNVGCLNPCSPSGTFQLTKSWRVHTRGSHATSCCLVFLWVVRSRTFWKCFLKVWFQFCTILFHPDLLMLAWVFHFSLTCSAAACDLQSHTWRN